MKPTNMGSSARRAVTEDTTLADRFNRVLSETVEAMEESGIRYVFIGGVASGGLGRPRSTRDIDLFVSPEDAEGTLRALAKRGFKTEKTDPTWLYKGFKEEILVDVIFKSKGEIYLDSEMYNKVITAEFHGKRLKLVAPEDLLIIKAVAHSELTPNHWHDAIALLSHANIDWKYLLKRAKRAPRRILSLLLYAQSNDIWVPNYVIFELYSWIFESTSHFIGMVPEPISLENVRSERRAKTEGSPTVKRLTYAAAHLRERLAEDPRTNELDIQIEILEGKIHLSGEVQQKERKEAVERIASEILPEQFIESRIRISNFHEPTEVEEFK